MVNKYDSREDTLKHIDRVKDLLVNFISLLFERALNHDKSKLSKPEKSTFDKYTPKLKNCTYRSEEYKQYLKEMQVALEYHYGWNSHHPEHYSEGIAGMNLIDIIEMFCDWKAAGERHKDSNIMKSIEINSKRFNIDEQLKSILINTAKML